MLYVLKTKQNDHRIMLNLTKENLFFVLFCFNE